VHWIIEWELLLTISVKSNIGGTSSNPVPTEPILFKYVPAAKADIERASRRKGESGAG
jgi:hypothetical protein